MSTIQPIPDQAMSVLNTIRLDIPKPKELPTIDTRGGVLRWKKDNDTYCPMGLHPMSSCPAPVFSDDFAYGLSRGESIQEFAQWWDRQYDAQAAVDAVWPPESEGK